MRRVPVRISGLTGRSGRPRLLFLALVTASLLALAPSAGAATTFGSSFPVAPENSFCGTSTYTNTALAGTLAAPFAGAIVRWRMDLAEGGGANLYTLRVLRPAGGSSYTAVGSGPGQTAPLAGVNILTLPTPLPVQAGDIIAIDCPPLAPLPTTNNAPSTSTYAFFNPVLGEGKTAMPTNKLPGEEMLINADVVGPPSVTSISPASGPSGGGAVVSLTGARLGEVSAVSFGGTPATFTLVSETQLFAVAPPGAAGAVSVSVINAAGTAAAPQTFTYIAPPAPAPAVPVTPTLASHCGVPKLKGKKLKAGRNAIVKADCKLGTVTRTGAKTKRGRVVKQEPKAGTTRATGSKVNVVLGGK
jgi:IPT/TIG domain/PASTA domain